MTGVRFTKDLGARVRFLAGYSRWEYEKVAVVPHGREALYLSGVQCGSGEAWALLAWAGVAHTTPAGSGLTKFVH